MSKAAGDAHACRVGQFRDAGFARPAWMRVANRVGRLFPGLLEPDTRAWWKAAQAKQPDAGEPTPEADEALDALVGSLREDARLNLLGRISARDDSVRLADTHLRILRTLRETPAVLDTQLPAPIFIVGWPRTGTTALHTLLAADPRNRTIPYWESFDPVPPSDGPDRRAAKVDRMLAQLARIAPDYHAIHPMAADAAEECVALFMNHFRTLQLDIQYRVPGYVRWLLAQDARIAYAAYRQELQLIHCHRPVGDRFVLKDPTHLVHLDTVLELFPDARIVFTHRDPARAVSSICSRYAHTRAIFSDDVDPHAIGREVLGGYWPRALERALDTRERISPDRRFDVRHADLVRDPLGTIVGLYTGLDLELDDAARAAMERHLSARTARRADVHEHRLAGFGLRAEEVDERFAAYRERFDLEEDRG